MVDSPSLLTLFATAWLMPVYPLYLCISFAFRLSHSPLIEALRQADRAFGSWARDILTLGSWPVDTQIDTKPTRADYSEITDSSDTYFL
ncbi:unnamed protein product [Protopolystoma xenopodis]|uniref:Uncharacterized protein n=1 Tax=Protopolystoma xenopodis TaxID=117903 RepID=A0A3S4ZZN4_9PLAT|nr:unnamed protein product [Protopolystoma xenopodis]